MSSKLSSLNADVIATAALSATSGDIGLSLRFGDDGDVTILLLDTEPGCASTLFMSPKNKRNFYLSTLNLDIHQ